jgi:TonB-dependent starch-binding outer membrane protein SusC
MKKTLLLIAVLLLLFAGNFCYAQENTVRGRITDAGNQPLQGVNILVKGSTTGTTTNASGEFVIPASARATLVISSVGFRTREIEVNGRTIIAESLQPTSGEMTDVVVIGYQTTKRKSVTTSIASVSAKDIEPYTTGTVATALQGKLPGVQVMAADGSVGSQPRILVRGFSSITANNNPLVIVDGMEIGYNNMNTINPLDIVSFDVLKDASAASIYGARSGQGVILITTRRGKGAPSINVQSAFGITKVPDVKLADANEFARVYNKIADNSGAPQPFPDVNALSNTNYWDETFSQGTRQNHNVSITGGRDGLSVFGSLGYYSEDSYAGKEGGQWRKVTGRLNADLEISKVFKAGLNFAPRYENYPFAPTNLTWNAFAMDPTTKPFRTEQEVMAGLPALTGTFADFMTAFNPYYSLPTRSAFNGLINPQFNLRTNFDQREYFGAQYGAYLEIRPIKNVLIKTVLDGTANFQQFNNYSPKYYFATNSYNARTIVSSSTSSNSRLKITNTAEYTGTWRNHSVNVLAGHSYDNYSTKGTDATRETIPFDEDPFRYINGGITVTGGSGGYQQGAAPFGRMLSFFGSLRYNFKEKYYLAGTMRADASSLVNPLYRWGYFPSLSAGWIISEEEFFKSIGETVSFLKLRASWGKSGGNLPGSVGAYQSYVAPTTYVDANGNVINGYVPSSINNPELKWEVQQDYTLALDAALFNNKLNITFENYVRNPKNLLLTVNVDYTLGYPQGYTATQNVNIGRLTTKGWDLSVGYRDNITKKLKFDVNLTLSHFKSTVDYLSISDPLIGIENNDVLTTGRSRTTVGHTPGAWWGYIADGVFQTDAEATSYKNKDGEMLQPVAKAGDLKFRDVNGDGKIDTKDLTDLGSPYPGIISGLTLNLSYGNFDFRTEFYGTFGQKVLNYYRRNMIATGHYNFLAGFADQYWSGPGSTNSFPILRNQDPNGNFSKMSTLFLENSDFVRCNIMQIGYRIPVHMVKGIKSIRVYASAQNLFTITKYSGLNPDVPWYSSPTYNGSDNYQMLVPRTYLVGVNLSL